MNDHSTSGPFWTSGELSEAITQLCGGDDGRSPYRLLLDACASAGVEPGGEDSRHLEWLSKMEAGTCVVFAGLIRRAYAAGLGARQAGRMVAGEGSGWISR